MAVPGYAVEYDHIDPRALGTGLELRAIARALLRGTDQRHHRIRGSRGTRAGRRANACCRYVCDRDPPAIDRANSYMAVMIDDLTLHGVSEPYRMLTARAEYRLRLRANNAAAGSRPWPWKQAVSG